MKIIKTTLLFLALAITALSQFPNNLTLTNDGTTGTKVYTLTKLSGANAIMTSTSDTGGVVGITIAGAGTSGSAKVQLFGQVPCILDNASTAGDYLTISSTTGGDCHDSGASYPTSGQVIGRVLTTNASPGTFKIDLFPGETQTQIRPWSCVPGLGDGLNAIPSGTYSQTTCYNGTGHTITITAISCFTDNSGTSTMNVTNGAGTGLLTGAITCNSSSASGTQSATTTIASGDYLKFTFVADGTTKQTSWVIVGRY